MIIPWDEQSPEFQAKVPREYYDLVASRVNAAVEGSGPPIQIGSHTVGPGATPQQIAEATQVLSYQGANVPDKDDFGDVVKKLGTGAVKAGAGLGVVAAPFLLAGGAAALPAWLGGGSSAAAAASGAAPASGGAFSGLSGAGPMAGTGGSLGSGIFGSAGAATPGILGGAGAAGPMAGEGDDHSGRR